MDKEKAIKPVVFLDRDGTLNVEVGYIRDLNDLKLIEGAGASVRKLNESGVAAILITNQTGAARGYYGEDHIKALNNKLLALLKEEGAYLDDVYYCPHLKEGIVEELSFECQCRKPAIGLVERAYNEHPQLDRNRSFVVGDKATDVELASNCGAKGVLVETGYGKQVQSGEYQWPVEPDYQAQSITEAISWILAELD